MKLFVASVLAFAAVSSAHASLVSQDYLVSGDGKLTQDSITGLNWLDLSETRGLSLNQILNGAGGWNTSFRIATRAEVLQLFADAGLPNSSSYQSSSYAAALAFVSLFDSAANACNLTFACGVFLGDNSYADLLNVGTYSGQGYSFDYANYDTWNFANSSYGVMLIQEQTGVVPEPTSLALAGLALVGLLGASRKRTQVA